MKKLAYAAAGLLIGGIVVLGILFVVVVRPWLAEPGDPAAIEGQWRQVEVMAEVGEVCRGDAALLKEAEGVSGLGNLDAADLAPVKDDGSPRWFAHSDLTTDQEGALERLVQWQQRGGGIPGGGPCAGQISPLQTFGLGRLAMMAWETGDDDPQVIAALYLAQVMRRCGSLILVAVGFNLYEDAVGWARTRGLLERPCLERSALAGAYRAMAPSSDEVLPAVAREMACMMDLAEDELGLPGGSSGGASGAPPMVPALIDPEREVRVIKQFESERLLRAAEYPDDPEHVAEALALPPQDELPKSLMLRIAAGDWQRVTEKIYGQVEVADEFLRELDRATLESACPEE